MKDRKISPENLRSGDTFRLFGSLCHFVGTIKDGKDVLYIYWQWNRYSRQRVYKTKPYQSFCMELLYAEK